MSRRVARGQQLPPQEVELLNSLEQVALIPRVHALYHAGWPLQTIGDSLLPKRIRTTIRSWVQRHETLPDPSSLIITIPIPIPIFEDSPSSSKGGRPENDRIPQVTIDIIRSLAPLARSFRSKMAVTTAQAVANDRLTGICITLYQKGHSIKELAAAAGVTYRAMYKRIKL
jgi:hypothetical protein